MIVIADKKKITPVSNFGIPQGKLQISRRSLAHLAGKELDIFFIILEPDDSLTSDKKAFEDMIKDNIQKKENPSGYE